MTLAMITANVAFGQDIETLVMPGKVIIGHADLESECSNCHKMFDKSGQKELCLNCHEEVAEDFKSSLGFHGRFETARTGQCTDCHTEHKGREADIVGLDEKEFDHSFTDYELIGKHIETACADCHEDNNKYREASSGCIDCHREDDVHEDSMGSACGDCHTPTDWVEVEFNHDVTGYPLIGKHLQAECDGCHEDQTFRNAPTDCNACHAEDDAHEGRSGNKCENCHNPTDWNDTSFDHSRDTDFELLEKHALLTCDDCHSETPFADELQTSCISCHLEDDEHKGHNGETCENCHNESDWSDTTFDHDTQTDFILRGGHTEVQCTDCHIEPVFEVSLEASCNSCHLDDDVHESTLGTQCANCHSETDWSDPVFFDHDLTAFPLLGKHASVTCNDCHETQAYKEAETSCHSCHTEDDFHNGNFENQCHDCHNPVAWESWQFDHDTQTDFPLTGAHVNVNCESCHRVPLEIIRATGETCSDCHRSDDVHNGEFGLDCGRCHSSESFRDVRTMQ